MQIAQELAGFTLGQADNLRRAMGKKKAEVLQKEYVPFSEGMARARSLARGHQGAVGHPRAVRRLRLQQGALGVVRRAVVLDGLPQGQLPGRVHGGPAHQRQGRQGQVGHLPQRVPAPRHPGAAAGRQRVVVQLHLGRRRHPLRPVGHPQRRRERGGRHRGRTRGGRRLHRLHRLPREGARPRLQQAGARLAHQGRRVRLARPPAPGAHHRSPRTPSTCTSTSSATPRSARTRCSAASTTALTGVSVTVPTMPEWEKTQLLAFERDMLGLYVSDHPLLGLEHVLRASSDCTIGQLVTDTERPDGSTRAHLRPHHRPCSARSAARATPGPRSPSRTSRARSTCCVFPGAYQLAAPALVPDTVVVIKGRVRRTDDGLDVNALEVTVPAMSTGAADAPVVVSLPVARCTSDVVNRFKQVLAAHPGVTRGPPAPGRQRRHQGHAARRLAAGQAVLGADRRPQGAAGAPLSGVTQCLA